MDIDELRSVRRTERQKDSLQHLRDSFYEDVATYIEERKAERKRAAAAADDPFGDPEVGQLTDEISTAEDVVEAIYERRVGKVVKLASFAAADMSADKSGLTAEERALFEDLVDRIKQNRRTVLDTLAGEGGDAADGESVTPDADTRASEPSTADAPSAVSDDPAAAIETAGVDDSIEAPAGGAEPAASETTPSPDEPASEPPTPDDVLAAAMGGGPDGSAASTGSETAAVSSGADAERESIPPVADTDADTGDRDVPVVDTAETDGGDATIAADAAGPATETPPATATAPNGESRRPDGAAATQTAGTTDADSQPERVTLRITEDVGRIYGVDEREYDLASEDVVTLPATNAGPLVERDAAERLE